MRSPNIQKADRALHADLPNIYDRPVTESRLPRWLGWLICGLICAAFWVAVYWMVTA